MEEFAQRAGIKLTAVPFKGNADNMQAILSGHTMGANDTIGWAYTWRPVSCACWPPTAASAPSAG